MHKTIKTALAAALLIGSIAGTAGVANAASVGFNIGNVSLGFNDGYWDNAHHWHKWRRHADMDAYRTAHADTYHEWRHDDKHHHD